MEIFLVRHGETGGNVAHRHQAEHTSLSFKGEDQARAAGKIINSYNPTHLLASNLVRTLETAGFIGEACGLVADTSPHLIELVRPEEMYGHRHRSFKSVWFYFQWYLGNTVDGESYQDILTRIRQAQELIEKYPKDARLVVVSHSVFISLFVAHLCRDKKLSPLQAIKTFHKIVTMPNTHITSLHLDESGEEGSYRWSLG